MAERTVERTRRLPAGAALAIGFAVLAAVRETAFLIWPSATVPSAQPSGRWDPVDAWSLIAGYVPADDGTLSSSMLGGLVSQVLCGVCCLAGAMLLALRNPLGRTLVLLGAGSRLLVVAVALVVAFVPIDGSRVLDLDGVGGGSLVRFFLIDADWVLPLLVCAFATGRRAKSWVRPR
ncbi:hypothetical protein [Amycolatopsis sp. GA6-003]|uniref:hypothetical protein n=1 Tax=Amycolatopsis sp. GA6-003 TaxID=2652444 RepID=UPI003916D81A